MPQGIKYIDTPAGFAFYDNTNFRYPKHLQGLNSLLLDLYHGKINKAIVSMPPRHGKSTIISKYFPAWYLLHRPDEMVMLTSYGADFAATWGRQVRNLINEHGERFNVKISQDSSAANRFNIEGKKGGMNTAGAGGDITGKGANLLIIDDPVKNDEVALSNTQREKIWDWFTTTAYTRLEPNAKIIIVMTRWHYDDLAGRLIREYGDSWKVFNYQAINENGEALWSERYPIDKLNEIKNQIGSYWFSALYQQQPIATEHQIFNPSWWQFYDNAPSCQYIIQVWDTAFKTKQENDYSVCATWGINGNNFYLLSLFRDKILFPDLERAAVSQYNIWQPKKVLIEDAASGQDLIPTLKHNTLIPIIPIKTLNKEIRAHAVSAVIEQGRVFLPKNAEFLSKYVEEHSQFPHGQNDDIVDTTTIALQYLDELVKKNVYVPQIRNGRHNRFGITKQYTGYK